MDIRTQATLLAAIVTFALGGAALLRDNRARVFTLFSIFSANLGLYSLADFLHRWRSAHLAYDAWERLAVVMGALLPASALAFFLEFLGVARRPARRARNAMLAGSVTGLLVAASPLVKVPAAKLAVTVYVVSGMFAVLTVLWNRLRAAPTRVERARLQYLFVGACITVVLSTLDVLPRFGVPYPLEGLGAVTLTLFMFFLSQTLLRHRLLDLHEFLGKIVVVSALGLVLVAIYGGLVSWTGDRPELFYFNTLVASFVILSFFEPMREKVEEWVVVTLFRERYELVRQLQHLLEQIGSVIDPARLATVLLDGLAETRRVTHASLWLLADDRPGYRLMDSRGPPPGPFLDPATARALLGAAASGQKAILLENIDRRLAELRALLPPGPAESGAGPAGLVDDVKRLQSARGAMVAMRAGIAMPLTAGERVVGFLSCWDERVPEAFASNEIAALIEVADRAALVIENSKLYQQMKERDRLAALGEMAAGLAHEIRNPLAAIQGAIQLLLPPGGERDAARDGRPQPRADGDSAEFLGIIAEEVRRLNGVVTQFLDYSRPAGASLAPGDVNVILQRTLTLLQADLPARVEMAVQLQPDLPRVSCDPEQLRQLFLNLALNAVQAMPGGGKLQITTRLARDEVALWRDTPRRSDLVEIRFADTGPGIPEEAREHVFVPFYTTKEKGTGLGLAICQRIVKAHGGTIGVRTAEGGGAEFVIALPALWEPSREEAPPAPPPADTRAARRRRRRRPARNA